MSIKLQDEGHIFTVDFITGRPIRFSHKGKHWPITTQCIIKHNDLVVGIGEVIKHENEKDNPRYGRIYAAKKAFKSSNCKIWREMRERLWKEILAV